MEFKSNEIIKRYPDPVLTYKDVPYSSNLTFNAGVAKKDGKYVMMFRNDYGCTQEQWESGERFDGTNIGLAFSDDGIHWKVEDRPCFALKDDEINRAYDPRITVIDGRYYVCFAVDTKHGVRGGIAVTDDFDKFEILSMSVPDNRNMVLFPEKINGKYYRLERPMPVYSRGGKDTFDIWLSESPDLVYWGNSKLVLGTENVPFCNDKIGPGAPPVKTEAGWLALYHFVDIDPNRGKNGWEEKWKKRYSIGVMLLDLDDPSKVIGMSKAPLMVPETKWETSGGFRDHVLFPCGMIEEGDTIRIYYNAGDAVVCLAECKTKELIDACKDKKDD